MGLGIVGPQAQGVFDVGQILGEFPLFAQDVAQVVVRGRRRRIDLQGSAVMPFRFIELSAASQDDP